MVDPRVVELVNQKVLPEVPKTEVKSLGILVILSIASALITLWQNCPDLRQRLTEDSDKVLATLKNPNFFHKARLYLTVRRQCKKDHTEESFHTIVNAILDAGKKATKEDVVLLCDIASLP